MSTEKELPSLFGEFRNEAGVVFQMRKRDLERYEKLLLKKRAELVEEMGLIKESSMKSTTRESSGDLSSFSYHMADQGTDAEEREKAFLLASQSGRVVLQINDALRRIKDKTYGVCEVCGEPINPKRLEIVPHARMCIACKEKEEQGRLPQT
jgi:DnaK suppressor protein